MKSTFNITNQCNMNCSYCYADKNTAVMSVETADKFIDYIFANATDDEDIHVEFSGGEPLLEFDVIRYVVNKIRHEHHSAHPVEFTVVSNGTIFSESIIEFLKANNIKLCISCDGANFLHDQFRYDTDGNPTSWIVEYTILQAVNTLPFVAINVVYNPKTVQYLPETISYLSSLGVRQIYLNHDLTFPWREEDLIPLKKIYASIATQYITYYRSGNPHFINLIDDKITLIMQDRYTPDDYRHKKGVKEFAFTPSGHIYPCESLVGTNTAYSIGNIGQKTSPAPVESGSATRKINALESDCIVCRVKDYCSNWNMCANCKHCEHYDNFNKFLCVSEKEAITRAFIICQVLEEELSTDFAIRTSSVKPAHRV